MATEKAALSDQNMLWFMLKLRYGLGISCTIMIAAIVYYIVSLRGENIITIGQCVLVITLCIAITEDIWDLTKEFGDVFEQIGVFSQAISLIQKYTITDIENAQKLILLLNKEKSAYRDIVVLQCSCLSILFSTHSILFFCQPNSLHYRQQRLQ